MTIDKARKQRLWAAGALLAPVVLALGARTMLSAGPQATLAQAAGEQPAALEPVNVKPPTKEQLAALAWLRTHPVPERVPSPMLHPKLDRPAAAAEPVPEAEPIGTPEEPLPVVALSAVLGRDGREAALLNGRVHRVGDEVVPGWTVRAINARAGSVELIGPGERTMTLSSKR
jgi:hypothetical protein